jgi:hypothetical protein
VPIEAVQHVRRMRGGAQSHLMRAADGGYYVVKFQNNPQHLRVLANELLATRLAERLGLPVPAAEVIVVKDWLVEHTPELNVELAGRSEPCRPGLAFGSRFVIDPLQGQVFDYLPEPLGARVRNLEAFAGILVLDKWTCNSNGRQAVFWKRSREQKYTATFIDQGYCFNAGEWTFPDSPLRGVYARNEVYRPVRGWESFQPWLARLEALDAGGIGKLAAEVPPEWYGNDWESMEKLVGALAQRRPRVRELITEFRRSSRDPFPEWKE